MRSAALSAEDSHVAREGGLICQVASDSPVVFLFLKFSSFFIWSTNYIFLTGFFLWVSVFYLVNQLYFFDRFFSVYVSVHVGGCG